MTLDKKPETSDMPTLYAGVKYYDLLISTRIMMRDAAVTQNYESYVSFAFQYYNMIKAFITEKEQNALDKKLKTIQENLDKWSRITKSIKKSPHADYILTKIRDELRDVEGELQMASKELMVKTSKGASDSVNMLEMSRGS